VAKVRKNEVPPEEVVEVVGRLHKAYAFRPECYRFVGLSDEVLRLAGVVSAEPKKRQRKARPPA
jgi:hypothetical protein